ncbi:MAG TPA: ATP-binding protein [Nitrospiraceae bacterium]|nr:ATP-binding protein [Nitrospiraceae bacterium]
MPLNTYTSIEPGTALTKVLLVEDNGDDALLTQELIREVSPNGFSVVHVSRLSDALSRLSEEVFDIVLLDLSLIDTSGLDTVKQILSAFPTLPIVILSGLMDEILAIETVRHGAQDYMVKGQVNGHLLIRSIRYAIERKHMGQEMMEAKDRAEQVARERAGILEAVEAFFISVNGQGAVREWTAQAERLFGIPLGDAVGQPFASLQIQWNWGEVLRAMREAGDKLQVVRIDRIEVILGEGKKAFVKMTVSPIRDNSGIGYIFMGEDITGRLVLEHELAQAQKLESIGQLAAGIAHEINTPIQFVGDNVRFLSDSFADLHAALTRYREILAAAKTGHSLPSELIETCEAELQQADLDFLSDETPKAFAQTVEGIKRVATIVRAMKEFAHPGSHEKAVVDLNKAIESTVIVARNEWKYVADLQTNLDPLLPPVLCLVGEFNQVVLNMIINATHAIADAVKGTGKKGMITISTTRADDSAEIRIADTGGGIPEAIRHKIFDPFFTTKDIGKGTGQGLAIARSVVVDKHGGTIGMESDVGKGTTFIIRLPLSVPTDDGAVEKAA